MDRRPTPYEELLRETRNARLGRFSQSDREIVKYHLEAKARNTQLALKQRGVDAILLGIAPYDPEPCLLETQDSDWIFYRDAGCDPTWLSGDMVKLMPKRNRLELDRSVSLLPDDVIMATAHQMQKGSIERIRNEGRVPLELIEPVKVASFAPITHALTKVGKYSLIGGKGAARGGYEAGKAAAPILGKVILYSLIGAGLIALSPLLALGAIASADPLIIAVITQTGTNAKGQLGAYILLTSFDWPTRG